MFQGDWALTAEYEEEEHIRRVEFLKNIIPSKRARFKVLSQSYQVGVISIIVCHASRTCACTILKIYFISLF